MPPVKDFEPEDDSASGAALPFFHAHRRLVACAGLLLATAGGLYALGVPWVLALLLGFDAGALVFLLMTARVFGRTSAAAMRRHAQ
ncbi:hypothetical protein [Achromobacter insolitus]